MNYSISIILELRSVSGGYVTNEKQVRFSIKDILGGSWTNITKRHPYNVIYVLLNIKIAS
jgi:hypothetical protein